MLGQGGMGVVVAATHVELDEQVAIKFLQGVPSEALSRRFLAEARAAAKIKNEHVCRAFDFGRTPTGEPYIVMELLEGCDLSDELTRRGPLAADEVVRWARQACEGLAAAHALGIVHRDIKPENLFLVGAAGGQRKVKVLDFGVSKTPESNVTRSAVSMGSPLYMAPEQMASSRDVDARADVWSLGATLYELLSGSPPFEASNVFALAALIKDAEAEELAQRRRDLPPELCAIVSRCLAKDPAARFADASELGAALARVHVGGSPSASFVVQHAPAPHDVALVKTVDAAASSRWPAQTPLSAPPVPSVPAPRRRAWSLGLGLLGLGLAGAVLVATQTSPPAQQAPANATGEPPASPPTPPTPTPPTPTPPTQSVLAAAPPLPETGAVTAPPRPSASATSGHAPPRPSQRAPAAPSSQSPLPTTKPLGSSTPPRRL